MINVIISIVLLGGAVALLVSSKTEKKNCGCGSCTCHMKQEK